MVLFRYSPEFCRYQLIRKNGTDFLIPYCHAALSFFGCSCQIILSIAVQAPRRRVCKFMSYTHLHIIDLTCVLAQSRLLFASDFASRFLEWCDVAGSLVLLSCHVHKYTCMIARYNVLFWSYRCIWDVTSRRTFLLLPCLHLSSSCSVRTYQNVTSFPAVTTLTIHRFLLLPSWPSNLCGLYPKMLSSLFLMISLHSYTLAILKKVRHGRPPLHCQQLLLLREKFYKTLRALFRQESVGYSVW